MARLRMSMSALYSLSATDLTVEWKKRSERRKHWALAVVRRSQKFSPCRIPPSRGRRTAKCNQLEMVTLYLQTQFGQDRCTQFRVIVVTDPQTHTHTHKQTHRQDRLQYTAPLGLARSVTMCRLHYRILVGLGCKI